MPTSARIRLELTKKQAYTLLVMMDEVSVSTTDSLTRRWALEVKAKLERNGISYGSRKQEQSP